MISKRASEKPGSEKQTAIRKNEMKILWIETVPRRQNRVRNNFESGLYNIQGAQFGSLIIHSIQP